MYNKSDYQLLIMQATIESNRKGNDEKLKKLTEDLTAMITSMMYYIEISKSSPDKNYSPKFQYPTTVVPANKRTQPLESVNSTKISGM